MASPIENSEVYLRARAMGRQVWDAVVQWPMFARKTVGEQFVTSMDSVAANLVEGDGRESEKEAVRFFVIARASAREARHWLNVSAERSLLPADSAQAMLGELTSIVKMINGLIAYRRQSIVREPNAPYDLDFDPDDGSDPFNA